MLNVLRRLILALDEDIGVNKDTIIGYQRLTQLLLGESASGKLGDAIRVSGNNRYYLKEGEGLLVWQAMLKAGGIIS
jgi:hypothetical protein